MKTVLMIGGGMQQVPAVELAHALGLRVAVTDRSPASPAFAAADEMAVIDGRDVPALIEYALSIRSLRGVFTLTELVESVAHVARAAGLPGASPESAAACQDKAACKELWLQADVPTPWGAAASSLAEARAIFERLGSRAFVKPTVGFGGRGARAITSDAELRAYCAKSTERVIVEALVTGSMHDVNGLIDAEGRFHPLGIADRFFRDDVPVERELRIPSALLPDQQERLYALTHTGVRALGVTFGPVKADAVLTEDGFQLLEVAPRLHGPKSTLYGFPLAGFEPMRAVLHALTAEPLDAMDTRVQTQRYLICRALDSAALAFDPVRARQLSGIEHCMLFAGPEDRSGAPASNADVPGYLFSTGRSFDACEATLARAMGAGGAG